jgi:hypothetical protein
MRAVPLLALLVGGFPLLVVVLGGCHEHPSRQEVLGRAAEQWEAPAGPGGPPELRCIR